MQHILNAARQPLFIAVIVVSVLAGLFGELWLLPLGLLVYAACVVLASRDPAFGRQVVAQQKRSSLTDNTYRTRYESIQRSREQVLQSLKRLDDILQAQLSPTVVAQTSELVQQAYNLSLKGQDIAAYLSQVDTKVLQEQLRGIDGRISRTNDEYTRNQLESTRQALRKQYEDANVLQTYQGRIVSQLENIDANLDAMPAQLMRLKANDLNASTTRDQVERSLSDLNADMHAFVSVLDSAVGTRM